MSLFKVVCELLESISMYPITYSKWLQELNQSVESTLYLGQAHSLEIYFVQDCNVGGRVTGHSSGSLEVLASVHEGEFAKAMAWT